MQHLKASLDSLKNFNKRILTISHMSGADLLPFPGTLGGGGGDVGDRGMAHFSPPELDVEYLKYVLTECIMFCNIPKVQIISYFGTLNLFGERGANIWMAK